jgi:hypothetical protein
LSAQRRLEHEELFASASRLSFADRLAISQSAPGRLVGVSSASRNPLRCGSAPLRVRGPTMAETRRDRPSTRFTVIDLHGFAIDVVPR